MKHVTQGPKAKAFSRQPPRWQMYSKEVTKSLLTSPQTTSSRQSKMRCNQEWLL